MNTVEITSGDLFASGCRVLVNPVNCVGVMGAGLAREFRQRYPLMFAEYQNWCTTGALAPGQPMMWSGQLVDIICFPTKRHWRQPSQISDIVSGLVTLRQLIVEQQLPSLALPALGCGLGGLAWPVVEQLCQQYLGGLDIPIKLYAPR
jgi:O-acetyl-ADP-ribose deacetylase (regulator of RNase III)